MTTRELATYIVTMARRLGWGVRAVKSRTSTSVYLTLKRGRHRVRVRVADHRFNPDRLDADRQWKRPDAEVLDAEGAASVVDRIRVLE